jgi:orotate phosphoribosyltransferase
MYQTGCLQFDDFVLTSGLRSPYYVDLSNLYVHTSEYLQVVEVLAREISREQHRGLSIVGVPLRGLPFAVSVANRLRLPFYVLRKQAKSHGTSKMLEGSIDRSNRVVIIDDVATTGGSLHRAAEMLTEMDFTVNSACVILDRLQGAGERLRDLGVELKSLTDILESLEVLERDSLVQREVAESIRKHVRRSTHV